MLSHEWRELETLCERISDLRHRLSAAQRTKNAGLIEGLKDDVAKARRQREQLVHHIAACLGWAAADQALHATNAHRGDSEDEEAGVSPEPPGGSGSKSGTADGLGLHND